VGLLMRGSTEQRHELDRQLLLGLNEWATWRGPPVAFTRLSAAGGLKRYGASPGESARQKSARPVDRLSNGADPATLPVEPLTRFELVLDVTTAQAMRLSFPPDLRDLADRVIKRRCGIAEPVL